MNNKTKLLIISLALLISITCACNKTSSEVEVAESSVSVTEETERAEETEITEETVATTTETSESTTRAPRPTERFNTPTPDPDALIYEGAGTINPLPEMSFQEMEMASGCEQEAELNRYLNDYLVPSLGINAEDRFYTNEIYPFIYDNPDSQYYYNYMGTPDLITDGEGIFGYYIMDFDKDGNLDMVVLGLAKGTVNSNLVSYYYRPYMLLCSISDNMVYVSDILYYQIECSDYELNYTYPLGHRWEPAFFTSSDTSSFYYLTRAVDMESEVLLQGYSQKIEGFIGNGQVSCAFEMRIRDGKFQYITYARCNGWGSADQSYTIFSYNNGVIDMNNTEECLEIYPYLEEINWNLYTNYELNWNTVNRGFAYHYYGDFLTANTVTMIYDIVNH